MSGRYTEAAVQVSPQISWFKLKERNWKIRSTKVDDGDFKHELLNWLRSTMVVNVLIPTFLLLLRFPSDSHHIHTYRPPKPPLSQNSINVVRDL